MHKCVCVYIDVHQLKTILHMIENVHGVEKLFLSLYIIIKYARVSWFGSSVRFNCLIFDTNYKHCQPLSQITVHTARPWP
jgi:hypothetical protein